MTNEENIVVLHKMADCESANEFLTFADESMLNKKYKDYIFKHKSLGVNVRCDAVIVSWRNESIECTVGFYLKNGSYKTMSKWDFDLCYEKVGKAKYSSLELEKMKFELLEKGNNNA